MNEFQDGLFLMGVGMGTVFLFLCLLIATTWGLRLAFGEDAPEAAGASSASGLDEATRTAVITSAITHHKKKKDEDG